MSENAKQQQTIEMLKQKARESWPGETGERRAEELDAFLRKLLPEYAKVLDMSEAQVLEAIEAQRTYSAINYYQAANFPPLDGVRVYDTKASFAAACPSRKYRCPKCSGVSTNPYECNVGECDWKSFGLFGTLDKGLRVVVKDTFLEHARVHEIFMPLELEKEAPAARQEGQS